MLQILCKTPAAIFKIQIPANTKSKFNNSCLTRQLILSLAASPFKLRDEGLDVEYYTFIFFVVPQFIG